jgi:hypothetical protein
MNIRSLCGYIRSKIIRILLGKDLFEKINGIDLKLTNINLSIDANFKKVNTLVFQSTKDILYIIFCNEYRKKSRKKFNIFASCVMSRDVETEKIF